MDHKWLQWVQDNIQRRCDPESILEVLLKNGFPVPAIQQAMGPFFPAGSGLLVHHWQKPRTPHEFGLALARKYASLAAIQRSLSRLSPKAKTIERRLDTVSRDEFLEKYYAANRPVILCGLMNNWPAMTRWTADYLKATCGDEMVEIMTGRDNNPLYDIEEAKHRHTIKFADYVDMAVNGKETNDYYMVARNAFLRQPGTRVLLQDIELSAEYLNTDPSADLARFWFGPKGTITSLHHDDVNIFIARFEVESIQTCACQ